VTTVSTSIETEFVDNLRESADALEAVVRAERQRLKRSLDELGSAVREKVNVRSKLRGHPLITVGASLGAGIALGVMSNRVTDRCDARSDAFLSPAPKTQCMHRATSSQTQFSGTLGNMASTVAALVGQRLASVAEAVVRNSLSRRRRRPPSGS
jgi:alpha-beta hydrolase superfamily lysophospholipase